MATDHEVPGANPGGSISEIATRSLTFASKARRALVRYQKRFLVNESRDSLTKKRGNQTNPRKLR